MRATGTEPTADELDARLTSLEQAIERVSELLLELELDPTRELLEHASLAGVTVARWSPAARALAESWEAKVLLEGALERARALRGKGGRLRGEQALRATDLLLGSSLEVPGRPGERATARELVDRIGLAAAGARAVLAEVSVVWDALVPRLTTASATLHACGDLAVELGAEPGPELDAARAELARLTAAVSGDPLGADPAAVDALEASVAAARAGVERVRDLRAGAGERLDAARALLDDARAAAATAADAHAVTLAKIVGAELPEPPTVPADLAGELDAVAGMLDAGAWRDAAAALTRFTTRAATVRDEARRTAGACRAPLGERNALRGLLGAYQAKAQRTGLLEDRSLGDLFDRAHLALHTAPTDLRAAASLVHAYQQRVSGPREVRP